MTSFSELLGLFLSLQPSLPETLGHRFAASPLIHDRLVGDGVRPLTRGKPFGGRYEFPPLVSRSPIVAPCHPTNAREPEIDQYGNGR